MPSHLPSEFLSLINTKACTIGVIGLGYVGLPLIDAFTTAGYRCLGFDVDPAKVDSLTRGQSYIKHINSTKISEWLEQNLFEATTDMQW